MAARKEITYDVDENGCWNCTSHHKDKDGYTSINRDGKVYRTHRYIYELRKGPIPEGLIIRHTCDNNTCIHPDHLIPGTHLDNAKDRNGRNRQAKGEKQGAAKLTEEQVVDVYQDTSTGIRALGRKYDVSPGTIRAIKREQSWLHITKDLK